MLARSRRPLVVGVAALLSLALLSGCPKRLESPTAILEDAASAAESSKASARQLALAGWHAWLVAADAERARERFDTALQKDAGEPWALYGQLLLAQRSAHPERGLDAALQLVTLAPRHPLSAAAARYLLELTGVSTGLDARILTGVEAALSKGPPGDTAHLLRSAIALVNLQRSDTRAHAAAISKMGVTDRWTLVGPFSAFNVLDFDQPLPPLQTGAVDGDWSGPFGKLKPRVLRFPDGRLSLAGEPTDGDLYVLAVDLELPEPADYVVRSVTASAHKALLDGTTLFERRAFERAESTVSARAVRLRAGKHRLMLLFSRSSADSSVSVSVMRADGAPANVKFTPAQGGPPSWQGAQLVDAPFTWADPSDYARALEKEAGPLLARFVAVRDGMGRHPDGARRLMSALDASGVNTAAISALRADLWLADRTIPARVARGRATRDLEAALEGDKSDVSSLLVRAQLALDDGRTIQAADLVKRAQAAHSPVGYPVALLRARVDQALGVDAQAGLSAEQALSIQPGLCDALALQYGLARKRDAVQTADELVAKLEGCPGSLTRRAEHARSRGRIDDAIAVYERLAARDPGQVGVVETLAGLYVSAARYDDAVKLLQATRAIWPRYADLPRRLAEVYDYANQPARALAAREAALALAGGDLALRRIVHRAKTGKELLSEYAIDGAEAIRRYEASPGTEDADSLLVLDAGAVQAYADGSSVDRIHTIEKALSQDGVSQIGEVSLPPGATVLALRTLKRDGTVLEPEQIAEKETVSMPGVQIGDYVEVEYLGAHAPRGPAQPGFTAPSFYFQVAGTPNYWSTYVVSAPRELGMRVDAHNVRSPQPAVEGGQSVFRHDEQHVPPYIPEPDAPPNPNEYLPFVVLGAGATGNDGLVRMYADAFVDRGQRTFEVESFARKAAEGRKGEDAVRALYAAVMNAISGRDAGLGAPASFSVAQERGSRLWTLKAGLEAIGVPTRVAAIRTFQADPAPYLFPNEQLLPYIALRAELGNGRYVWLDTAVRFGPFGELPEAARGREAYLFPEAGKPLEKVTTPTGAPIAGKQVTLDLALATDGTLSGRGEERYTGFDAAQLVEWLDQLPPDQRKQSLQGVLARYFGGAEMETLDLELKHEVGADLVVRYTFRVPRFARVEAGKLVVGPVTFPVQLGRRYVQLGTRSTPLFIESTAHTRTSVKLKLPAGYLLNGPLGEVTIEGNGFGSFVRKERQQGDTVEIEEDFLLPAMRLAPSEYDRFAHFAGQLDLLQTHELLVEKR